jgi:hypothetical protein
MSARDVSGSLRKFTVEGQSFAVAADANVTETITNFENAMVATSGAAMRKMTKRVPIREGLILIVNADERVDLIAYSESLDDLQISYTNAAGDEYKCQGTIEIENSETEENRLTCQIHPRDGWETFIGA